MSLLSVLTTHGVLAVHTEKHSKGFTKDKKKNKSKLISAHLHLGCSSLLQIISEKMETNDNVSEVQHGNNNDLLLSFVVQYSSGIQNGCSSLINTTKKAL